MSTAKSRVPGRVPERLPQQPAQQSARMPIQPDPVFKIERDIPLHKVVTRVPSVRFPLDDMKVGESFYVANRGSKQQAQRERVRVQARRLKPKQFAIRTEGDGMRVWRVK